MIRFLLLVAFAAIFVGWTADQAKAQDEIVATIGNKVLTTGDLTREFANRGTNFGPDLRLAAERLRNTVIAEYWVDQNFADLAVQDPATAQALGEARRQVLFEVYAQSTFVPTPVSDADIETYISENPELFGDRRSYVFQRTLVLSNSEDQAETAQQVINAIDENWDEPSDFVSFTSALTDAGLNFSQLRQWAGSEALEPDLRTRLLEMSQEGRKVDVLESAGNFDIVILMDAYPDPADPDQMRDQISGRIMQERYAEHRRSLAQNIAEPLLGTQPSEPAIRIYQPTPEILVASAVAGLIFGLALSMYIAWFRCARAYVAIVEQNSLGDFAPKWRNQPKTVAVIGLFFTFVLLIEIGLAVLFGPVWVRTLEVLAAFFGVVVLGAVLGLLIWRVKRDEPERDSHARLRRARRRSLYFTGLLLVGGVVLVLRPAPVTMLVDFLYSTM